MLGVSWKGTRTDGDSIRENMFIRLPIKKSSGLGIKGGALSSGSEHPSSVWPNAYPVPKFRNLFG